MTAINSMMYRVRCLRGTETATVYLLDVWARDVMHAYEIARQSGYTPVAIE